MPKGQTFPSERKFIMDETTGIRYTRLTSFPALNTNFYMHDNCFTPDSKTLVFRSQSIASRNAPTDLFKVDTDGNNLTQITEGNVGGPLVSFNERALLYTHDRKIIKLGLDSLAETEICGWPEGVTSCGSPSLTNDCRYYVAHVTLANGRTGAALFDLVKGESSVVFETDLPMSHMQVEPNELKYIAFQNNTPPKSGVGPNAGKLMYRNIWVVNIDGTNPREVPLDYGNGHWMWHGTGFRIMSALDRLRGVVICRVDDDYNDFVTTMPAWHSGSSRDGRWVISDSNWPDMGLLLTNTDTRKTKVVCETRSSSGHPQWSHPHPGLSPDMRFAVFSSDRFGHPDVFCVELPEGLKAELAAV